MPDFASLQQWMSMLYNSGSSRPASGKAGAFMLILAAVKSSTGQLLSLMHGLGEGRKRMEQGGVG